MRGAGARRPAVPGGSQIQWWRKLAPIKLNVSKHGINSAARHRQVMYTAGAGAAGGPLPPSGVSVSASVVAVLVVVAAVVVVRLKLQHVLYELGEGDLRQAGRGSRARV